MLKKLKNSEFEMKTISLFESYYMLETVPMKIISDIIKS